MGGRKEQSPRCGPKDNTDKFGENSNISLIQIEHIILGMTILRHTRRYLRNPNILCIHFGKETGLSKNPRPVSERIRIFGSPETGPLA